MKKNKSLHIKVTDKKTLEKKQKQMCKLKQKKLYSYH